MSDQELASAEPSQQTSARQYSDQKYPDHQYPALHSPANMAYRSRIQPLGDGPGWGDGLIWSVLPAAIGNILGAFFLVGLPFHIASGRRLQSVAFGAS